MADVSCSIVIVSMNKPDVLRSCLDSIRSHTHAVSYETFVVAYLYDKAVLARLRREYPWVLFVESDEIRGFSENNNLALRQAQGRYCFVVNDDTLWHQPVIDSLVAGLGQLKVSHPKAAIISPVILKADQTTVQYCGRSPINAWQSILLFLNAWHDYTPGPYTHQQGIFQTYTICGAAFLIDRQVFQDFGWFDERFFFCPEDIDLSTRLNQAGYSCWVDSGTQLVHLEGMSGKSLSRIQTATMPAYIKGTCLFYAHGKPMRWLAMAAGFALALLLNMCRHWLRSWLRPRPNTDQVLATGELHSLLSLCDGRSPKEAFIHYYNRMRRQEG